MSDSSTNIESTATNYMVENEESLLLFVIIFMGFVLFLWASAICFCCYVHRRSSELRTILSKIFSQSHAAQNRQVLPTTNPVASPTMITIPSPITTGSGDDTLLQFAPTTSVDDPTSDASSPFRSPFGQAIQRTFPEDLYHDLSPISQERLNHKSSIKGLAENKHGEADSESKEEFPKLRYDIKLMDIDLRDLGLGASGTVKEKIYTTAYGEVKHVAAKYARDYSIDVEKVFRAELEIISKLPLNQNIVEYFGGNIEVWQDEDNQDFQECFIIMELMFTNLQDVIHGSVLPGGLDFYLIHRISLDIANGLDHLHQYGIIHYDMKPSNVLLTEDFVAKLADFGSSKQTLQSKSTASIRGTLGYIAPEVLLSQYVDKLKVTDKLDIFSMGVVMWEMVSCENPPNPHSSYSSSLQGSSSLSIELMPLLARKSFRNASEDRCPPPFRRLIEDCLNMEPDLRPTTQEIKDRLLAMISNDGALIGGNNSEQE